MRCMKEVQPKKNIEMTYHISNEGIKRMFVNTPVGDSQVIMLKCSSTEMLSHFLQKTVKLSLKNRY